MNDTRICPQCGNEFTPVNEDHIYCVKQCRYDYNNARKQKPQNADDRIYTRLHGGNNITIPDGYILVSRAEYEEMREDIRLMSQLLKDLALRQSQPDTKQKSDTDSQHESQTFDRPTFDDEDLSQLLKVTTDTSAEKKATANQNFFNSLTSLIN